MERGINVLQRIMAFFKRESKESAPSVSDKDEINYNYVCLTIDPINTVNDLREGDWNMNKVRESLSMGILRYAKKSEVEQAKAIGRIKN